MEDAEQLFCLYDLRTGKALRRLYKEPRDCTFSPDGRLLAASYHNGKVHLWETATGGEVRSWQGATPLAAFPQKGPYQGGSLVFSPDGQKLACVQDERTALIWVTQDAKSALERLTRR